MSSEMYLVAGLLLVGFGSMALLQYVFMSKFMKKMKLMEPLSFLEQRHDRAEGLLWDVTRHVMRVLECWRPESNPQWAARQMYPLMEGCWRAAARLGVPGEQLWKLLCTEVNWRSCRDYLVGGENKSLTSMENASKLQAGMWSPLIGEELEDFMQNKSSEILFFQLQVVARVQEVRALLASEELAEEKKAAARLY
ncbi:unnamed protein product, partial [Symbiodinium sp. CCMP2456]